jgi:hypothetical protein
VNRVPVDSSNLATVGYDPATAHLEIEFVNGSVYCYGGVPAGIHSGLMSADSKGRYFHRFIRDVYPFQRLV